MCTEQTLQNMIQQPDDYRAELHVVIIIKINQQYIYGVDFEQDQNIYHKLQCRVFITKDKQTKILWVERTVDHSYLRLPDLIL